MSNGSSNDWQPPSSDSSEPRAEQTSARPSPSAPMTDRAFQTMKTLVERAFDGNVVFAYLVMFGVWMLLSSLFAGGFVAAMFAAGLVGSASAELAGPALVALFGGGFLIAFAAMIAWQTFMIGLQRPLYRVMHEGADAYTGVGDVLQDTGSRFFPILGVTLVIGTVVYGGGLAGASAVALPSLVGVVSWEPGILLLIGYFLLWVLACIATGLFFGPATYFVATREIGVISSLTKSFSFVKNHLTEMLVAWGVFLAGCLAIGCVSSVATVVPGLGNLLQFAVSVLTGFAGLCYWISIYMMLEDEDDSSRNIAW